MGEWSDMLISINSSKEILTGIQLNLRYIWTTWFVVKVTEKRYTAILYRC